MYIIREVFTAQPGQGSRLAKLFKHMSKEMGGTVMTDMVGPYNTVVMEMQVESLAEWEQEMMKHRSGQGEKPTDPEVAKEMEHYHEMYQSGRREIYQVVD